MIALTSCGASNNNVTTNQENSKIKINHVYESSQEIDRIDYFENKRGAITCSNFQIIFFEGNKSQLTYDFSFLSGYGSNLILYDHTYTYNYTDYFIENRTIYLYEDEIPQGFSFHLTYLYNDIQIKIYNDYATLR